MPEAPIIENKEDSSDFFNALIAITVALLAGFMAITKVKDDNIVQAMLQAKSDAVDTWSEYQSTKIKRHLAELAHNQTIVLKASVGKEQQDEIQKQIQDYEKEIERYKKEEPELQNKAKGLEKQYDDLNYRDDQFDLSDAILSVSMAMLAVAALTKKKWLLAASWVFAVFGVVMGVAGLLAVKLHPDWLTKLLS
jgi:hypothetical protein